MPTVIRAFDDRNVAQRAVDRLAQSGFDRQDIHVEQRTPSHGTTSAQEGREDGGWFSSFLRDLFGTEDQANTGHAHTYDEAVRRGSSVVVVEAGDSQQAERAASLLDELGAVDVDERARQWRADGWTDGAPVNRPMP